MAFTNFPIQTAGHKDLTGDDLHNPKPHAAAHAPEGTDPLDITYTNPEPSVIEVGGIDTGTTFDGISFSDFMDQLLYPELFPTLTNPSLTAFTASPSGLREIGEVTNVDFNSTFSRGTISPAYGTSGFRSGLPNNYVYTGAQIEGTYANSALSDARAASDYLVISGAQSWTCYVAYDAGEQPKSSKDNDFDSPLAAGNSNTRTITINGVYPWFATTSDITTLTKQTLAAMNSTYVQASMVAESGSDKQAVQFPVVWAAITGIQFYNTVSSTYEWIGGSKANSLLAFDITATTNTVQGAAVDYNVYTHNGSLIGARILRFYTN